jgi:8-oxo-dGTP pyrophosphatase MutT (NUDIX family)
MNIKIYHLNKTIYLTDVFDESCIDEDTRMFARYELDVLKSDALFDIVLREEINIIVFIHPDLDALKKAFFANFELLIAAGGVVENPNKEVLLMHRRKHWDLPKGKWDDGETIEECALREIAEETGVQNGTIQQHLFNTYHTYTQGNQLILKETYWYYITINDQPNLVPQTEEDIEQLKWVKKEEINNQVNPTFASIKDVLMKYLAIC